MYVSGSVKPDEWDHYGLALGQYTHFTSPIRRYADVIVHRLLLSATDNENQDWWSAETNQSMSPSGKVRPVLQRSTTSCDHLSFSLTTTYIIPRRWLFFDKSKKSTQAFYNLDFKVHKCNFPVRRHNFTMQIQTIKDIRSKEQKQHIQ